jgi:hypothetical protein
MKNARKKRPIAANAQPRLRQLNASARLSGSCSLLSRKGMATSAASLMRQNNKHSDGSNKILSGISKQHNLKWQSSLNFVN